MPLSGFSIPLARQAKKAYCVSSLSSEWKYSESYVLRQMLSGFLERSVLICIVGSGDGSSSTHSVLPQRTASCFGVRRAPPPFASVLAPESISRSRHSGRFACAA